MSRKPLIKSKIHPYHVTGRCNNRETFYCNLDEVWELLCLELSEIIEKFQVNIHAFVLMPNHFHLLISTPTDDLSETMKTFMCAVTKKINLKTGRSGRVFGSRYHWS